WVVRVFQVANVVFCRAKVIHDHCLVPGERSETAAIGVEVTHAVLGWVGFAVREAEAVADGLAGASIIIVHCLEPEPRAVLRELSTAVGFVWPLGEHIGRPLHSRPPRKRWAIRHLPY